MEPYQERVVTEKVELDNRRAKLKFFMESEKFKIVLAAEQDRMKRQLRIMNEYSEVLRERIAAFK